MQTIYYYYRNMTPPIDDKEYINKLIIDVINGEYSLIISYQNIMEKVTNPANRKIYENIIVDAKTHIRLLKVIYGNINNKIFDQKKEIHNIGNNVKDIIIKNVEMSKKYRKILYSLNNETHRYMIFDIIVDNINNSILLNTMAQV